MHETCQPDVPTQFIVLIVELDGEDAALCGAPLGSNPYPADGWEHQSWSRGWLHGACGISRAA